MKKLVAFTLFAIALVVPSAAWAKPCPSSTTSTTVKVPTTTKAPMTSTAAPTTTSTVKAHPATTTTIVKPPQLVPAVVIERTTTTVPEDDSINPIPAGYVTDTSARLATTGADTWSLIALGAALVLIGVTILGSAHSKLDEEIEPLPNVGK